MKCKDTPADYKQKHDKAIVNSTRVSGKNCNDKDSINIAHLYHLSVQEFRMYKIRMFNMYTVAMKRAANIT